MVHKVTKPSSMAKAHLRRGCGSPLHSPTGLDASKSRKLHAMNVRNNKSRASMACERCKHKKVKCEDYIEGKGCEKCRGSNEQCMFHRKEVEIKTSFRQGYVENCERECENLKELVIRIYRDILEGSPLKEVDMTKDGNPNITALMHEYGVALGEEFQGSYEARDSRLAEEGQPMLTHNGKGDICLRDSKHVPSPPASNHSGTYSPAVKMEDYDDDCAPELTASDDTDSSHSHSPPHSPVTTEFTQQRSRNDSLATDCSDVLPKTFETEEAILGSPSFSPFEPLSGYKARPHSWQAQTQAPTIVTPQQQYSRPANVDSFTQSRSPYQVFQQQQQISPMQQDMYMNMQQQSFVKLQEQAAAQRAFQSQQQDNMYQDIVGLTPDELRMDAYFDDFTFDMSAELMVPSDSRVPSPYVL